MAIEDKYRIGVDLDNIIVRDKDGYFFAMDGYKATKTEEGKDYKTEFTEKQIRTYLKKAGLVNSNAIPTDKFVKEYIDIFCRLYGPWSDGYVKGTSRFKEEEKEFEKLGLI